MVDRVLEGERLQAALLAEGRVQRPPHLRRALRLTVSGRGFRLVRRRLGRRRVGVGVKRSVADGGLRTHPAEAGRSLMVRRGPLGAMEALRVLEVHQRDAATVRQQAVPLLLMLLGQQGALDSTVTVHRLSGCRLEAAATGSHRC